jgi:hypothetical protein
MRRECEAGIVVKAPAAAVWDVISDVTRVGEWSGECRHCEWGGTLRDRCQVRGSVGATVAA